MGSGPERVQAGLGGESVLSRKVGHVGRKELAGLSGVAAAKHLSDGVDVTPSAQAGAGGYGGDGRHARREQEERKHLEVVRVVQEAAVRVERVERLAGGQASPSLDSGAEVGHGVAFLESYRQVLNGEGASTLKFSGDWSRVGRCRGHRRIPRQVHANQLVLEVHEAQCAGLGNGQNWTTD